MSGRVSQQWNAVPIPERVAARAYGNIKRRSDGCWISTYSIASHGYAQVGWQGGGQRHIVLAHRAAWVHVNGQLPLGMTLDHTCKTRACVNPEHLRLLPNFENARRNSGKDWPMGQCGNGHPNSALVLVRRVGRSGKARNGLTCGECKKIRVARGNWRARHPDAPLPDHLFLRSDA